MAENLRIYKRLLMKAIICWDYLLPSRHLVRLPPTRQALALATFAPFAVLSYRNLHGEYDFSDQLVSVTSRLLLHELDYDLRAAR